MALADELAGLDSFAMEVRRHADVADHHIGRSGLGSCNEAIVILGLADDLEVVLAREHGLDPLADEDAVVGDEDCDRSHASIQYHSCKSCEGVGTPFVGDASHTPRTAVCALEVASVRAYGCPDQAM